MLKLNLGCSDQFIDGFIGVDAYTPAWATPENFQKVDLRHEWPWADGSVDHIRAHDIIEHLPLKIVTMNNIHRVLKPGGTVEIVVPTTEGRGADQDPTHCSYWNRNSFFYHTEGDPHYKRFHEAYGISGSFRIVSERQESLTDHVTKLHITLEAVKTKMKAGDFMFSILHTSARPDKWREVYDAWLANAVNPEQVEYVLCVDYRWGFPSQSKAADKETWGLRPQDKVIWNTGRSCYVDGVNLAAEASSGDILIVNADDQFPCEKWDDELLEVISAATMESCNPPSQCDFVVSVSTNTPTEHERGIMVMPILSRERYERFGFVFYKEYTSMYADNDFCAMAKRDGCIIDARHLVFPHKHWINGQREKDEADRAQNSAEAYEAGAKLFAARKRINFNGVPPPAPAPEQANDSAFRTSLGRIPNIAFLTPGNAFSMAWVDAWTNLILQASRKYNTTHLMCYTSNAGMVREKMARVVLANEFGFEGPVDFVVWIDDDNTLTLDQLDSMLDSLRRHPELDAVVGWTWCGSDDVADVPGMGTVSCGFVRDLEKTDDGKDVKFCHVKQVTPRDFVESATDLIEIDYSGFPAVVMRAELLKKAGPHPFRPFVDSRCEFGFSGEDLAFFMRAKVRSGARFAVDRRIYVPHYKRRAIEPRFTTEQMAQSQNQGVTVAVE